MGDIYLKISDIPGDAQDDKHKDEIEVLSWSWGAVQPTTQRTGGGSGTGDKVQMQDVTIVKNYDSASYKLAQKCSDGKTIPEAILVQRKSAGDGDPIDYIKYTLKNVIVSSYQVGASDGVDVTETVSLNFNWIRWDYTPSSGDTGSAEGPTYGGWDVAKNVPV